MTADLTHEAARALVLRTWVDGADAGDAACLRAYLARCLECAAYTNRIEHRLAALRAEQPAADPGRAARTRARLRAYAADRAGRDTRTWLPVVAGLLACAALLSWSVLAGRLVASYAAPLDMAPAMIPLLAWLFGPVRRPCPGCGALIEEGVCFCPQCRHQVSPVCPGCDRRVGLGQRFCAACGRALAQQAQAP